MRSTFRKMLPALLAVLALSAVGASAAQASTEGPFYKIAGARLSEGQSKEVKAKKVSSTIVMAFSAETITCSGYKLAPAAKVFGSTGANAGTGEETMQFTGCTVTGNGEPCNLPGNEFKTQPLAVKLAYTSAARTGRIAEDLRPAAKKTGEFADLKFEGSGCGITRLTLEGETVLQGSEVGKESAEAAVSSFEWPSTPIKTVWVEEAGKLVEKSYQKLSCAFGTFTLTGSIGAEIVGGGNWGVYTH